jgi:hypothetical protein
MEVDLLHEIPVRVMRAADIQYYTPPDVPPPRVQLELPYNRVRAIRHSTVKRQSACAHVCVYACADTAVPVMSFHSLTDSLTSLTHARRCAA